MLITYGSNSKLPPQRKSKILITLYLNPTQKVKGTMNRSFTKSAWNSMSRQQQRTAAANMEVVGQLAKRKKYAHHAQREYL